MQVYRKSDRTQFQAEPFSVKSDKVKSLVERRKNKYFVLSNGISLRVFPEDWILTDAKGVRTVVTQIGFTKYYAPINGEA